MLNSFIFFMSVGVRTSSKWSQESVLMQDDYEVSLIPDAELPSDFQRAWNVHVWTLISATSTQGMRKVKNIHLEIGSEITYGAQNISSTNYDFAPCYYLMYIPKGVTIRKAFWVNLDPEVNPGLESIAGPLPANWVMGIGRYCRDQPTVIRSSLCRNLNSGDSIAVLTVSPCYPVRTGDNFRYRLKTFANAVFVVNNG
jgi:hypothetical protein